MKNIAISITALIMLSCSIADVEKESSTDILTNGNKLEVTEKNIPNMDGLGVYCILNNSGIQHLTIKDDNQPVSGAYAELFSENELIGAFQYDKSKSCYTLNYKPVEGKGYTLKISYNGEEIVATTTAPYRVERKFYCNPILITQVYRNITNFFSDTSNSIKENGSMWYIAYPSYALESEAKSGMVYSYFTNDGIITEKLASTHNGTDRFNSAEEIFSIEKRTIDSTKIYKIFPNRSIGDKDGGWAWKKIDYPLLNRYARIAFEQGYTNSYNLSSYICAYASTLILFWQELAYIMELIKSHPEYGCYEKDYEFWGPAFSLFPTSASSEMRLGIWDSRCDNADKQVIMGVSNEYDLYLLNCKDFKFSSLDEIVSNYTNITGGYGIFGADYKMEYDYKPYNPELTQYYIDIINELGYDVTLTGE